MRLIGWENMRDFRGLVEFTVSRLCAICESAQFAKCAARFGYTVSIRVKLSSEFGSTLGQCYGLFTPPTRREKTVLSRLDPVSMSPRWWCEQAIRVNVWFRFTSEICKL